MKNPFRLVVVNSHPIQYFAPLYAYLNSDPEIEMTALYCSDSSLRGAVDPGFKQTVKWDIDLLTGYKAIFLGADKSKKRTPAGFWSLICPEVWAEIRSGRYDGVLLHGYGYAAYVQAFLAAKSKGLPVFFRSETHLGLHRAPWKRRLRDTVLSVAFRFVDRFLAVGTANREYYRVLGVPAEKLFDVPYTVDNRRLTAAATLSAAERSAIRSQFDLPENSPLILYASKLSARKHPDKVLIAFRRVRELGIDATLMFAGTGELDCELHRSVEEHGLGDVVRFAGFVNQSMLPRIFAASDIFVLPAENEPWGLIVNEAMCAGLPVVIADEVGCVPDLVRDGENGVLVKAGDAESLTSALRLLLQDEDKRRTMGRRCIEIIDQWSYERCRIGILAAIATLSARGEACSNEPNVS